MLIAAAFGCLNVRAQSPRETPAVKLIRKLQPGVVAVFSYDKKGGTTYGSGSVIHESGFILTVNHVVEDRPGDVLFADGRKMKYFLYGRVIEKDLAIIKIDPDEPCVRIPLGRSGDLMTGEPILNAGNPGGRGVVFSSGIVNSPALLADAGLAVDMADFQDTALDRYIQYDATSNRGNSGGPLINAEGIQVGVADRKVFEQENINYAIPADRVRTYLPDLLAPEERRGYWVGVTVNMLAERAVIRDVAKDSPAAQVGVQPGDIIVKANDHEVRDPVDWELILLQARSGQLWPMVLQRGNQRIEVTAVPADYPRQKLEDEAGKQKGLKYDFYQLSHLRKLPDFSKLKPTKSGVATSLNPVPIAGGAKEHYAIVFEGFVKLTNQGFQRLVLSSDDGSRLFLDDRLVVDSDGPHPLQDSSGPINVQPGLHRLRIEYFNGYDGAGLKLYVRGSDGTQKEISEPEFFH
jgi:S1-C subfamily serine protease